MFTGIIEDIGTVREFSRQQLGAKIQIEAGTIAEGLRVGDSIAVDGACLTVTALKGRGFTSDLSTETFALTTLGSLWIGARVNLERPLRLGDRLGGHFVTGHVDAIGRITEQTAQGDGEFLRIRFPQLLNPLLVMKGSVAVDGISLTLAELSRDVFGVAVIPYTLQHTTLGGKRVGDAVNLEADLLGKHVARFFVARSELPKSHGLTLAHLEEHGFA